MKAIIIEDEKPARVRLRKLLLNTGRKIDIIAEIDSVKSSIEWFDANKSPDLIFLDIQLADGQSFEIFKKIKVNAPIIFTTAYDEFALKAFEQNCIDYLLKPVDEEKLRKSLDKMNSWLSIGNEKLMEILENAYQKVSLDKNYKTRFLVKGKNKLISVQDQQIAYFQAQGKLVLLCTFEGRYFPVEQTLEELESTLDPQKFFRINRSIISNLNSVKSIEPYFNGKLLVHLDPELKDEIYVSREKAPSFKKWMGE